MRFTPKTEDEIARENMLSPGVYDFEVAAAEETTSKAGNEMVKLKLTVFDTDGGSRVLFDYLLESVAYKLRHFAEATGLLDQYARGEMDADLMIGKCGRCKVSIQKDKTGNYPDRNGVADYVVASASGRASPAPTSHRQPAPAGDLDDEIPF